MEPVRKIRAEVFAPNCYDGIWFLGNAGFIIRLGSKYIMIDPAVTDKAHIWDRIHEFPLEPHEIEKMNCVLYTHEHSDHMDRGLFSRLRELEATVCAPEYCMKYIWEDNTLLESQVNISVPGKIVYRDQDFEIETISALHGSRGHLYYADVDSQHNVACGYLIKTLYGNILHPGDSYILKDHSKLQVDYLLLPINDTNFGAGFAAQLTLELQPKVVIPCHYGMYTPTMEWHKSARDRVDNYQDYYGTYAPAMGFQGGHPAEYIVAIAARDYKCPKTDIMILKPGGKLVLTKS